VRYTLSTLLVLSILTPGCSRQAASNVDPESAKLVPVSSGAGSAGRESAVNAIQFQSRDEELATERSTAEGQPALDKAALSQPATNSFDRKIIRNGDLTIETAAPAELQRKISSLAENHGGFVVTSEATQRGESASEQLIRLTLRVPAAQFGAFITAIRGTGDRLLNEKISGQDVTEEFIDLEARLKTKRALESQFLEIMKSARGVEDALRVQRELFEVRTEIERLDGRRRFLENQSALSTVNVTLTPPASVIAANPTGFFAELKEALREGGNASIAIILFLIKTSLALLPPLALIGLPVWFLGRLALRRLRPKRTEVEQGPVVTA
jgi:Domain of unknown function (DUF4349)